ncbi:hypothetical protein Thiosp_00556 [Thiorhodovibrio litoralis]|nr:hypothetical protein Thiosp_00556 [Thiorhodovibrio litoralis]
MVIVKMHGYIPRLAEEALEIDRDRRPGRFLILSSASRDLIRCAHYNGQVLNYSKLAGALDLAVPTLKRYLARRCSPACSHIGRG